MPLKQQVGAEGEKKKEKSYIEFLINHRMSVPQRSFVFFGGGGKSSATNYFSFLYVKAIQ